MLRILKGELIKIFSSKKVWISLSINIGLLVVTAFATQYVEIVVDQPLDEVVVQNESNALSFSIMGLDVLGFALIVLVTVVVSDTFAGEYKSGTLKLIMTRPVARKKIFLAKVLSAAIYFLFLILASMALSYIVGGLFFDFGEPLVYMGEKYIRIDAFLCIGGAYLFFFVTGFVFILIIFLIGMLLNNASTTIATAIGIYAVSEVGWQITQQLNTLNSNFLIKPSYIITYHFNLARSIGSMDDIVWSGWNNVYQTILVIMLYGLIAYVGAYVIFKKKDILA